MHLLRTYRLLPLFVVAALVTTAFVPLVQSTCTMVDAMTTVDAPEMPPCHGSMPAHDGMPMSSEIPDEAPAPVTSLDMPCCTPAVAATVVVPQTVLDALVALTGALIPSLPATEKSTHGIAADESPPERPTPLYIAHGRFLI